ncbi:MAG: SDR family NAD(P)-dependent oxidoreductase [Muribaculaceae bacterium]|nr:SDR family NAD(P)-dependent oxidoreductase [Muribaculaceae bacterium]
MKRIVIIGASSGIGRRVASDFARLGMRVGIAARREEPLKRLAEQYPDRMVYSTIDVTSAEATQQLEQLIERLGGMDIMLVASGMGKMNPTLDTDVDLDTVHVNVGGFVRMVNTAYRYFRNRTDQSVRGQIAVITSVAGTKGIGIAASYSASKRFGSTYIDALDQLAHLQKVNVDFTDIRPGFIRTDFLAGTKPFPLEMALDYAAPRIELAILRRRRVAVIDSRWRCVVALWNCIPQCVWSRMPINVTNS